MRIVNTTNLYHSGQYIQENNIITQKRILNLITKWMASIYVNECFRKEYIKMTNMNSGVAVQGSRLYLQQHMVNSKDELSQMILSASPSLLLFIDNKSKIEWKSPLEKSEKGGFYEYKDDFLEVLGLDEVAYGEARKNLESFGLKMVHNGMA